MFIKENVNPKKRVTGDCVTRAFTKASGKSYEDILTAQYEIAKETGYSFGDNETLSLIAKKLGFNEIVCKKPSRGQKRIKVSDIAKDSKNKRIVCRIAHHLTAVVDGNIYDIWDCSDSAVYRYYVLD